jgi:branched-chain amino acid transport system substrate-binding protein
MIPFLFSRRILLLWPALGLLVGCGPAADDASVFRIGEYASLTGETASFGQSSHQGTRMAVDEINAAGGVLGRQLKLITEDDRSTAGEPANVVRKLISRDKVVAVLGEVASSRSLEAAPICQQARIPMISPASTNPKVTETGDFIFRICFIDPFQGAVMSKFALGTLQATKAAVLTDVKNDYSVGLSRFFKEHFTANGGTIVSEQSCSAGDTDFKAQLTAIKATAPDVLFVPVYYNECALIALQARDLGITAPLLGGDGWDSPKLLEIGGKAVEGGYFSNHYSVEDQSPAVQEFIRKYKDRHGGEQPDAMAALGYDSARILADALQRAGGADPDKLRDAIAATRDFPGVTGRITLDANRNASKPAVVLQVRDGAFRYVETVAP